MLGVPVIDAKPLPAIEVGGSRWAPTLRRETGHAALADMTRDHLLALVRALGEEERRAVVEACEENDATQ